MAFRTALVGEDPETANATVGAFNTQFLMSDRTQELLVHLKAYVDRVLGDVYSKLTGKPEVLKRLCNNVCLQPDAFFETERDKIVARMMRISDMFRASLLMYISCVHGGALSKRRIGMRIQFPPFATFLRVYYVCIFTHEDVVSARYWGMHCMERTVLHTQALRIAFNELISHYGVIADVHEHEEASSERSPSREPMQGGSEVESDPAPRYPDPPPAPPAPQAFTDPVYAPARADVHEEFVRDVPPASVAHSEPIAAAVPAPVSTVSAPQPVVLSASEIDRLRQAVLNQERSPSPAQAGLASGGAATTPEEQPGAVPAPQPGPADEVPAPSYAHIPTPDEHVQDALYRFHGERDEGRRPAAEELPEGQHTPAESDARASGDGNEADADGTAIRLESGVSSSAMDAALPRPPLDTVGRSGASTPASGSGLGDEEHDDNSYPSVGPENSLSQVLARARQAQALENLGMPLNSAGP